MSGEKKTTNKVRKVNKIRKTKRMSKSGGNVKKCYVFKKCINNNFLKNKLRLLLNNQQAFQTIIDNADKTDDDSIFTMIIPFFPKQDNASFNVHKIKYLDNIPGINSNTKILDFGGANGLIAKAIAEKYKLRYVDVCDVHDPSFAIQSPLIRYSRNLGKLPYADNEFDVITCFMVLHHIPPKELPNIINEIYRCSNKYLLIQEHDCKGLMGYILDILHGMYTFVYKDDDYDKLESFSQYCAWYKSAAQFSQLFAGKFQLVLKFNTNKIQENFVALYEKI
jgi:2-polyprenyl-3-methyl-5-hydroxy-6-metoxy-1,4-benzoquinol methylase